MQTRPPAKARYLGMTMTQIGVLAFLGLVLIGLMGFAGWTVLGASFPNGLFPTRVVPPTWTPLPTRTLFPTRTPPGPSPTPTVVDYKSLIPEGWVQFTRDQVEIWMPPNFQKADPGTSYILAKDKNASQDFTTNILVGMNDGAGYELDDYIRDQVNYFPAYTSLVDMTMLEKKKFSIGSFEARRLRVETILLGVPVEAAMYIVKDGTKFWMITCSTHYDEYYDWLPTFDKVARTFRLNP